MEAIEINCSFRLSIRQDAFLSCPRRQMKSSMSENLRKRSSGDAAMTPYYTQSHHMLETMLSWRIGAQTEYSVSCGKLNKYFRRYLPEETYQLYLKIFPDSSYENFRKAIKVSCGLFRETAVRNAESLGMAYPVEYEQGFEKYIKIGGILK